MRLEFLTKVATLPRLTLGSVSSILGAITAPAAGVHWLQLAAWAFSALAGLATALLAFARIYDWARKTFSKKPTNQTNTGAE